MSKKNKKRSANKPVINDSNLADAKDSKNENIAPHYDTQKPESAPNPNVEISTNNLSDLQTDSRP